MDLGGARSPPQGLGLGLSMPTGTPNNANNSNVNPNPYGFESPRDPPPYTQPRRSSRKRAAGGNGSEEEEVEEEEEGARSRRGARSTQSRSRSRSRSSYATTLGGGSIGTPVVMGGGIGGGNGNGGSRQYFRSTNALPQIQQIQQIRQLQLEQFQLQPPVRNSEAVVTVDPPLAAQSQRGGSRQLESALPRGNQLALEKLTMKQRQPTLQEPDTPTPWRPTRPQKIDWWAWETSALVVSALAIGGIVAILVVFDGKPIPAWSVRGASVSLNTVLSVLSTLSRTSLLVPLDDALGQLMWVRLARRRKKPEGPESEDEANGLDFSMGIDVHPGKQKKSGGGGGLDFAQMLDDEEESFEAAKRKKEESRKKKKKKRKEGPSTKLIEIEDFGMASQGIWGCVRLFFRHGGMSLAALGCLLTILSLGLGPATQQLLSYPSRLIVNPNAESVVTYATTYEPATGALRRGGVLGETVMALYTGGTSVGVGIAPQYSCSSGTCTFPPFTTLGVCSECHVVPGVPCSSIPGNRAVCRANYMNGTVTAIRGRGYTTLFNQSTIAPRISQRLKHLEPWPLASLATLHLARFEGGAFITECALVWCVKQVNSRVVNGVYMENTTRVDVGNAFNRTVERNNGPLIITRNPGVPMNTTNPANNISSMTVSAPPVFAEQFAVAREAHNELIGVVTEKLTGFVEQNITRLGVSSDLMHVLSEGGKTPGQVFEGFATALTKLVRDRAARQGRALITGETWIPQSFIRVNWLWLTYPAAMWVFSAVFLAGVVCVSARAKKRWGLPVWGGSWLAAVLVGVDDGVARRARDMAMVMGEEGGVLSRDGMRRLGRQTKVRLTTGDGGGVGGVGGLRLRLVKEPRKERYDV